nr:retrotransposon protein [Tanacetum cinerariifolium]
MKLVKESISELRDAIVEIKEGMKAFLIDQKVVSNEINKLKNGEGTSNNAQNSGSQHQSGVGMMVRVGFTDVINSLILMGFGEDYPWELYAKEVVKRFDSVTGDPLMELKNLKQDGTVKDYHEKFESLLNRMELCEKHAISLFLGGVIRPSQSPFSSTIVMINKKDGTWRMCVDYRQLNERTFKDKFHIRMIEELIDELQGSVIFFKLNLRLGYHQIRMKDDYIHKTAFRTHDGIGAVLQQRSHPIAYLSKALFAKHQAYSTYEKEFLAVILALDKWKGYLMDMHFKIKNDHFSLKYLLDWRVTTPFQAKWLPTLLGFDYEISYEKGSENVAADAL